MSDLIKRQDAINAIENTECELLPEEWDELTDAIKAVPPTQSAPPERKIELHGDESAIEILSELRSWFSCFDEKEGLAYHALSLAIREIKANSAAQPERRYTEEELRVFKHGISLSLLSKRSSQHWQYDEDTATEIEFLERLYEKVDTDMRGEQE